MVLEEELLETLEPSAKRSRTVGDDGRWSKQASKQRYSKKRKFSGNQYENNEKKRAKRTSISTKSEKGLFTKKKRELYIGRI